ncbi:hypothetical protein NDU88_001948 [Pleurodeles waltl]|uniref:Uncharacterized protein n=1 Tax=Pleurodeles waltl TaxID=8319 RepID=A0AAV7WQW7_PLEWA|nr:hypothetical protein NDU88_001948 [Pleurodeles waltl]
MGRHKLTDASQGNTMEQYTTTVAPQRWPAGLVACDGPLLPQADLPCYAERECTATSDPEVQSAATDPLSRPGDEGQREPLGAITWFKTGEGSEQEEEANERNTPREHTRKTEGDIEDGRGDHTTSGTIGDPTDDRTARPSGT